MLEKLQERFDNYVSMGNLHGLNYLRSGLKLPIFDRIFWLTIFITSVIFSCIVINNVWYTWVNNPFVIVYDSNVHAIWDIPFPSVTICSFVAVKRSVFDLDLISDEKYHFFSSLICPSRDYFKRRNLSVTQEEMKSFYDFLTDASPTCKEMLRKCSWRNEEFVCCDVFFPIITSLGRCYIANSLPSKMLFTENTDKKFMFNDNYPAGTRYWLPDQGYPRPDNRGKKDDKTFPEWASSTGYESGLSVEIEQNMSEWQDKCSGGYTGFQILVNSPEEAPISSHSALRAPMKRDFLIELEPRTIRTVPDLSSTSVDIRGCLFQGERRLDYFGMYTQDNCILECLLEITLAECGCVPFYMPRNSSVAVCSKNTDLLCIRRVERLMVTRSMNENNDMRTGHAIPWCGCYPSCNDIAYDYVTNHGLFLRNSNSIAYTDSDGFGKVSIYYKDRHFLGVHRVAEISFYDILGMCGGLLGLTMGFSCISAVEVLYHVFIRPLGCLALRERKKTSFSMPISGRSSLREKKGFVNSFYE